MKIKGIITIFVLLFSANCLAKSDFICKLIVDKNTCWKDFDVEIQLYDPYEKPFRAKSSVIIEKGNLKKSIEFPCKNREYMTLRAKFSPTIWEGKQDEVYRSKKTWVIPTEIDDEAVDWRINLCYPGDFQGVPQPTGALRDCKCLRKKAAAIKLGADGEKTEIEELEAQTLKKKLEKERMKKEKEIKRKKKEAIKMKLRKEKEEARMKLREEKEAIKMRLKRENEMQKRINKN